MSTVTAMKPEAAPYVEAFRNRESEPRWLAEQREAALARFAELGFPTRKLEAWRFTDLRPLQKTLFPPAVIGGSVTPATFEAQIVSGPTHRLVFANGRLAPELSDLGSLPDGAWLASTAVTLAARPELLERSFADAPVGGQAFAALNAAFFRDGFVLALEPGVALEHPVEIVNLSEATSPQSLHLRSAIVLGAGSRARLIETFAGSGEAWTNAVTTISLEKDASLSHVILQDQAADALHFLAAQADLAAGASYESFVLTLGARLSRHDGVVRLQGKGARCGLNGAYLLRGQQEATHATVVEHAAPGATTRELWKGVADERAHGVFLGRIAVRPQAQQTDAQLQNRNLLLSARAAIDTKPELEILADDVKCSHGATVGDLDESALFYLRARGIDEAEARRMLIEAFALDALASIGDTMLREHLAARLRRWLGSEAQVAA